MTAAQLAILQSYFTYIGKSANIIASGPSLLTGPDASRWAMVFGPSDAINWRAFPAGVVYLQSPFKMTTAAAFTTWCNFPTFGNLSMQQWLGQAQTGTGTVGWIEVYYRPPAGAPTMEEAANLLAGA